MMKSAEKISKPSASFSLNPKKMQKSRFEPRSFEPTESEHEAPASRGLPNFSYNLLNIPAYPPIQRKESEEEEELLQGKMDEAVQRQPEDEEEEIQAKSLNDGITKTMQRQADHDAEDEEVLQGKFLPVQRKAPHFNYNLLNIPAYPSVQKQAESRPNLTGMPDQLKAGIESLSGIDISDVRVHANSERPASLDALAYTQGSQIYLGPGQEKHLPHEAWHVVQQAQGRVKPTMQMKDGVSINDDEGLEHEADVMGVKALVNAAQFRGEQKGGELHKTQLASMLLDHASVSDHQNKLKHTIIQRMLIPQRDPHLPLTDADVVAIIHEGVIDFEGLDRCIPRGIRNTWHAQPGDRITYGFKYEWDRWHVHGHAPDPAAPGGANASNGWVIRIKHGNKWLLNSPPVGNPSHWTRSERLANETHIPAASDTIRSQRRNSNAQ